MKRILIIPSWFKDAKSPSAGTFFEEEAYLMSQAYYVSLFVMERYWTDTEFKPEDSFSMIEEKGVTKFVVRYPQWHNKTIEENLKIQYAYADSALNEIVMQHNAKWDLIHAYATFPAGCISRRFSEILNVPYLITEHFGPFCPDFAHSIFVKRSIIEALENANVVLSVSSHLRQQILMQNINCNPTVVGNFVNNRIFTLGSVGIHSPVQLLTVAYYPSYIKDIDNLLSALEILRDKKVAFHLTLIGGGELKGGFIKNNTLISKVESYHLQQNVTVIGSCSRKNIVQYMKNCDIYVSSSIAETFGVCIGEAMLCGKPVVLTKNGGSEDFANINNSLVVEVHNPQQLAEGIMRVIKRYETYDSHLIRKSILSRYGAASFLRRISNIYEDALKVKK